MKSRNIIIGIVLVSILLLSFFGSNMLSLINIDGQEISCNIVQDSCDGWTDCKMHEYNGKNIACINGEKIFESPNTEPILVEPKSKEVVFNEGQ